MINHKFKELTSAYNKRFNLRIESLLPQPGETRSALSESMRYACLNGGKRLRPALCYATAEALQCKLEVVEDLACAIEFIHAYSLVHDDLPAMDNDDLRRGKPTSHKVYGDAMAILAGDALQALAFETIASSSAIIESNTVPIIIQQIARACGTSGMVEGQSLDLESEGKQINLDELENIHRLKTGALINAGLECSAIICGFQDTKELRALSTYGKKLGLAFQIHDDILDVTGNTQTLGKPQGSDTANNKSTYPALMGIEEAHKKTTLLYNEAIDALSVFGNYAESLRTIASFIVSRDH